MVLNQRVWRGFGACALALACAAAGRAQPAPAPPPARPAAEDETPSGVFRQVIYNGPNRTVHYTAVGLSPGEQTTLRNLERAENEVAVANDLAALRRQYIANERVMENRRHDVQMLLYGFASQYGSSAYAGTGFGGYPYFGAYGYPYANSGFGYTGALASSSSAASTAFGMGDEGSIKTEMARALANEATADRAALAARSLENAEARVAQSERLRSALGTRNRGDVAPVANEQAARGRVTVTLKGDQKVEGTLVSEDSDWITVDTGNEEVSVRKSEAVRIGRAKPGAKP
jgi:hypothetical protein